MTVILIWFENRENAGGFPTDGEVVEAKYCIEDAYKIADYVKRLVRRFISVLGLFNIRYVVIKG